MTILGIDPGTAHTGYGVIKVADDIIGREFDYGLELINYGNIVTGKDTPMPRRLQEIYRQVHDLIIKYQPDQISIEMLFFGANTKTAISVGQARGVIMLAAAQNNVPINEYTGLQVKLMVAGGGRADKKQVQEAVRKWLGEGGEKRAQFTSLKGGHLDDAIDAVAIAICHVIKMAAK